MIEKIKGVGNPLTIIAIFAALSEVMGTISLGLIDKSLQPTFIWFIILFPSVLVVLFFLTLNFNTRSIYAPSDFRNEDIFKSLLLNERIKPDEKISTDKEYVAKTAKELGIDENKTVPWFVENETFASSPFFYTALLIAYSTPRNSAKPFSLPMAE